MSDDIGLPAYWTYYDTTFKLEAGPNGEWIGSLLSTTTGLFERNDEPTLECLFATTTSYIDTQSYDDFLRKSERVRRRFLAGDGPIFALYETINAIWSQAEAEGRKITDQELALIKSIDRRTFKMWEDEQARHEAGLPPSFTVHRVQRY